MSNRVPNLPAMTRRGLAAPVLKAISAWSDAEEKEFQDRGGFQSLAAGDYRAAQKLLEEASDKIMELLNRKVE